MKKIVILVLALIMLTSCATTKKGSGSIAEMMSSTPMKDNYTIVADVYPPYVYMDTDGHVVGQDVEILRSLAKNMGVNFDFKLLTWSDAFQKAKGGDCEGIFTFYRNKEREKDFYFPAINISLDEMGILANPGFKGDIQNLDDLAGKKIITLKGSIYPEEFENYKKCEKVVAKDFNQLFEWLIRGNVKLAILGLRPAQYFLEYQALTKFKNFKGVIDKIRVMPIVLQVAPFYIAIPKKYKHSKELFRLLDNNLLKMQNSGELFKIRQKYIK